MIEKHLAIGKYISMLYRMNNSFFSRRLYEYGLRGGQQVFLLHISRHPGCSFQELAHAGHFDKATATRAVRKLEEEGYVRLLMDEEDKRVRHIYLTEEAQSLMDETWKSVEAWTDIITEGFTEEEKMLEEHLLSRMAANAHNYTEAMRRKEEI